MPPLDDNIMLSVDEYRSKLYELANFGTTKPPSRGRRQSTNNKNTPTPPAQSVSTFKAAAVAAQVKPSHDKQARVRAQAAAVPTSQGESFIFRVCSGF
jgi:hypothetical protein